MTVRYLGHESKWLESEVNESGRYFYTKVNVTHTVGSLALSAVIVFLYLLVFTLFWQSYLYNKFTAMNDKQ